MNNEERKKFLSKSLAESAARLKEEDDLKAQIARVTAIVTEKLKAETSQSLSCPHCGEPLPAGWRTDDVTSDTENADDVNEMDQEDDGDDGYDNRQARLNNRNPVRPLSIFSRANVMASLGKFYC